MLMFKFDSSLTCSAGNHQFTSNHANACANAGSNPERHAAVVASIKNFYGLDRPTEGHVVGATATKKNIIADLISDMDIIDITIVQTKQGQQNLETAFKDAYDAKLKIYKRELLLPNFQNFQVKPIVFGPHGQLHREGYDYLKAIHASKHIQKNFKSWLRKLSFEISCTTCMLNSVDAIVPELSSVTSFLYHNASTLVTLGCEITKSEEGVRQGCVLSSYLYALATDDVLKAESELMKDYGFAHAYLDDHILVFLKSPDNNSLPSKSEVITKFQQVYKAVNLAINPHKTREHVFSFSEAEADGIDILGCP